MPGNNTGYSGQKLSATLVFFIAGIALGGPLYSGLPDFCDQRVIFGGVFMAAGCVAGGYCFHQAMRRRLVSLGILLLMTCAGAAYSHFRMTRVCGTHIAAHPPVGECAVIGRLCDIPETTRNGARMDLHVTGIETAPGRIHLRSGRIRIYLSDTCADRMWNDPDAVPGSFLRVETALEKPSGYRNPGGFDPFPHLLRQGIHRTGYVEYPEFLKTIRPGSRRDPRVWIGSLKKSALTTLNRLKPPPGCPVTISPEDLRAVSKALLLGSRSEIDPGMHRIFREAGLVHLLAISGLHVGILAAAVMLLLRRLPGTLTTRSLVLIALAWFYAVFTGGAASVIRAVLLLTLCMTGRILHRPVSLHRSLSIAAILLLIVRPGWIGDPGFQLTFTATFGIAGLTSSFERCLPGSRRSRIRLAMAVALAAQTATAPISAFWFNRIGLLSFALGLCMIPLASGVLITGLGTLLSAGLPWIGTVTSFLHSSLLTLLVTATRWEARFPGATMEVMTPSGWLAAGLTAGALWLGTLRNRVLFTAGVGLIYTVLWANPRLPPPQQLLEMWFFDVGNGDCTVTRFPDGRTMIVDAGGIFDS
ncbi:MAG TPA: ComEC/Rec2 family competence protein, partial [bacterium]|nr:ComEC/Rec2 family competence protein [bacterium]